MQWGIRKVNLTPFVSLTLHETHCVHISMNNRKNEIYFLNSRLISVCNTPETPANGHLVDSVVKTVYRTRLQYACSTGFHLTGPAEIYCNEYGQWNVSVPSCNGSGRFLSTITISIANTVKIQRRNNSC